MEKVPYGYVRITGGEFKDQIGWCDDEEFMEEESHEVDEGGDSGANAGVVYFQAGLHGSFEVIPVRYLESLAANSAEVKRLEETWTPYWLAKAPGQDRWRGTHQSLRLSAGVACADAET